MNSDGLKDSSLFLYPMDKVSFLIFEPDKRFHLTLNLTMILLYAVTITFYWAFDGYFQTDSTFSVIYLSGLTFVSVSFLLSSLWRYEPINGVITQNEIEFTTDEIIIHDKKFALTNITDLQFNIRDFYGKDVGGLQVNFNARNSQGINNSVRFIDDNNQEHLVYFKLGSKHHQEALAPFINNAIKLGKLPSWQDANVVDSENIT